MLLETESTAGRITQEPWYAKLFERVRGAELRMAGAPPGQRVSARVELTTPLGRKVALVVEAVAGADGRATLRLPYATGANGGVQASPRRVEAGRATRLLAVPETVVRDGRPADLPLP